MPRRSLAELRERYADGQALPSQHVLRELRADSRSGAQALYRTLNRRVEQARALATKRTAMLQFERDLWQVGVEHVAGVDEVGMGPVAGPVVAAAVILPHDVTLDGVDDSKKLDAATRERLDREIRAVAIAVAIAEVDVDEIARINIYHAGLQAMRKAVAALEITPGHVLTDARTIPGIDGIDQTAVAKGDARVYSIASASIVAKVYRDRLMVELDQRYPGYGLAEHKGYATEQHMDGIRRLGVSPCHRRSYAALDQIMGQAAPTFYELSAQLDHATTATQLDLFAEHVAARAHEVGEAEKRKLSARLGRKRRKLARD